MTDILLHLQESLLRKTANMRADEFVIRTVGNFLMQCQPNSNERIFTEPCCLVLTTYGLGVSFLPASQLVPIPDSLIGQDGRQVVTDNRAMQVAILDACYAVLCQTPIDEHILNGDTVSKSIQRAKIVCSEIELIRDQRAISKPTVLMIGVVQTIVKQLQDSGMITILSDLDPQLIGNRIAGVEVQDGKLNRSLIHDCDIILATGMTITTATLDSIVDSARQYSKPLVMFAQTGSNFAEEYIALGIESVLAEHYPWYCFPGQSNIQVFRRR
jgi:hypothetical protein